MPRIDFPLLCARCGTSLQGLDSTGRCPGCNTGIHDTLNLDVLDLPAQSVAEDLACIFCGYNLRSLGFGEVCPECGRQVRDSIGLLAIDLSQMRIADDVSCINCGYNLRTLSLGSLCPECSKPVSASVGPDELRFASPGWLRRVQTGLTLLIVAGLGMLLTMIAAYALGRSGAFGGFTMFALQQAAWLVVAVLVVMGVFGATTPEPNPSVRPESSLPRRLARTWAILQAICTLGAMLSFVGGFMHFFLVGPLPLLMWIFGLAALIGLCLTLRRLARRAREKGLTRMITVFIWVSGGVGFGGLGLILVFFYVIQPIAAPPSMDVMIWVFCTLPIAALVLYIFGLIMLFRCRRMIGRAIGNRLRA
ncbi:MAG: hypothetical protein AMXMBFR13_42650 [Phycisphaerae bacterium]